MSKYWKNLSFKYMTEESDDAEDENAVIEHKLTWRSQSKLFKSLVYILGSYACMHDIVLLQS